MFVSNLKSRILLIALLPLIIMIIAICGALSLGVQPGFFSWVFLLLSGFIATFISAHLTRALVADFIGVQKAVQESLAREQNFTVKLIQKTSTPTFVIDRNHKVLFWNRACEALTGIPAEELIGTDQHWAAFHKDKSASLADYLVDQVSPSETPDFRSSDIIREGVRGEGWFEFSDNKRYLVYSAAPVLNDRGEIEAAVQTFEDITERKLLEEQLVNLTCAVTQSTIGIMITDNAGIIEYANPAFSRITGYGQEDVLAKHVSIFRWVDPTSSIYREILSSISSGVGWTGRFQNRRKNGELYWEDAVISPIKSEIGEITHYVAMREDISDRIKLEEELNYSQKMDSIGRMAGGLAHDFNNILTAISGYIGIAEFYTEEVSPAFQPLKQVRGSVERAATLVKGLLDFSRRQQNNPTPVDLNDVVKRVSKLLTTLLGDDISLHMFLSEKNLEIVADSVQVEQIIMHLANNSRDAMPGGGDLWIGTRRTALDGDFVRRYGYGAPGEYALLTVTDNGSGMTAETTEKIFEPFFSTKGIGGGSGLGLSVVYGSVKQHKGFLTCYSEPGKGTHFNIYLPLFSEKVVETIQSNGSDRKYYDKSQLRGEGTILLVEDDVEVRNIMRSLLEEFGYVTLIAENGKMAVQLFKEHSERISLCIFDAIMPKKSGWETYCEIKRERPWIKALFISGYARESLIEKGMLEDDSAFLPKPIAPVDLLRSVKEVLEK